MNYDDMDYVTLRKHQKLIESLIEKKKGEAAAAFKAQLDEAGFTIDDLNATASAKGNKTRKPAVAKYRNPANPEETYSGRGPHPQWFKEYIENGGNKDDVVINA